MTTMTTSRETAYTIEQALDPRNVHDQFKGMNDEVLQGEFASRRTSMVSIFTNLTSDFNKSTALRTHVGAGGGRIIFLNKPNNQMIGHPEGTKKFDKRGAVGMTNYADLHNYDINRYKEVFDELRREGYTIFAVDNTPGFDPELIYDVALPEKSVFLYGEEKLGLPIELIEYADKLIFLPMIAPGPRSYNVSVCHGAISMIYLGQNRHLLSEN